MTEKQIHSIMENLAKATKNESVDYKMLVATFCKDLYKLWAENEGRPAVKNFLQSLEDLS